MDDDLLPLPIPTPVPVDQAPGDLLEPVSQLFGLLAIGGIVYLALVAGAIAFGIWVFYTMTWRAQRRALHEFHHGGCIPKFHKTQSQSRATYPPAGWK